MNRNDVENAVRAIISEAVGHDDFVMSDDLTAAEVDGWDSLSHMNIIMMIENKFDIKFRLKELNKLKNMSSLLELILSKL